ncbi:MAG: anaerobic ribonucleoside-triphosphate reductase [Bacilli bacterium]|nr:anaerobic ribonucleoside-triphosphate reductase [Bacilli bacterium]
MKVKKCNNKIQEFDKYKIENAIRKAAEKAEENIKDFMVNRIANKVEEQFLEELSENKNKIISTDEICKKVEDELMATQYKETARQYITYHYNQQQERLYNSELIKQFQKKLNGVNIENSNANLDERSFSGRINEAATVLLKDDALHNMSKTHRNNHNNNIIYIHDLNSYSSGQHNCLSLPLDDMFHKNIYTKQTGLRPPRNVSTALQLVAVHMQVQSLQMFGGVSATHIDWSMVPFVRYSFFKHLKDGYTYREKEIKRHSAKMLANAKATGNEELYKLVESLYTKELLELKKFKFKKPKDIEVVSIDDYKDDPCYEYALEMTMRDAKQGAEGLIHNLNSLQSRSGNQLPFSSINYGTCTLTEGRMITNAILDATLDGTGPLHETPIFPCGIFQWDKKINGKPGTPNYDLYKKSLVCTAKRFYPNYCNANWSTNVAMVKRDREIKKNVLEILDDEQYNALLQWIIKNPVDAKTISLTHKNKKIIDVIDEPNPFEINSTMGCRTVNLGDANFTEHYFKKYIVDYITDNNELPKGEMYSFIQKDGRGNIAPATIILPTIAMLAKGDIGNKNIQSFMNKLDKKIYECKDELIERFTHIASQPPTSATFMYQNQTMAGYHPTEGIISALKHGTLAIGQLGLAETLQILIGKDHTTKEGMELAHKIEALFKKRCAEFKADTYKINNTTLHLNFGVYYTPAESLCHTALNKFVAKYGVIENVSDKQFFTNSMHIPVWHNITPFEKIDLEAELTGYSSAGCITYVELQASAYNNVKALEKLVNYAMEKDIPYFALNPVVDSCRKCGFSGEIEKECPKCGSTDILRLRRVTGYISNDAFTAFNDGKIDEVKHRAKHIGYKPNVTCDC